jgi:hypothetical protein
MNVKFKSALAVAALALGASAAQAGTTPGEIVFSIWNNVTSASGFTFDTGLNSSTFTGSSSASFTLGAGAVAAYNSGQAQWNLFASSSAGNLLTSTISNKAADIGTGANAGDTDIAVSSALSAAGSYYSTLSSNQVSSLATTGAVWANAMSSGGQQIGDKTDQVGAGSVFFETLSGLDGSATLFSGTWTLSFNGAVGSATAATLSWIPTSTSVPLPAAVWLLGSGLMGLAGVGRRRKGSAA